MSLCVREVEGKGCLFVCARVRGVCVRARACVFVIREG